MLETPTSVILKMQVGARVRRRDNALTAGRIGLLLALVFPGMIAADDYAAWSYSSPVYLNTSPAGANVPGITRDFPVLVRLNPGNFQFFSQTLPGGADIRFAKSDGVHLQYQIERWVDVAGDNDTAEIWVKIDTVYGNNSTQRIVMHWGMGGAVDSSNGAAVFDTANGFVGVWHLSESPTGGAGAVKDATVNALHATPNGLMNGLDLVNGVIGKAHEFDGVDDGDSVPYSSRLNITTALTTSAWFRANSLVSYGRLCAKSTPTDVSPYSTYAFSLDNAGHLYGEFTSGGARHSLNGSTVLSTATPYFGAYSFDGATAKLFLNGTQEPGTLSQAGTIDVMSTPFCIGKSGYPTISEVFDGTIDEVRLEKTARSPDWIKLCFENQKIGQSLVVLPQYLTWDVSGAVGIQPGSGSWGADNYWTKEGTALQSWPGGGNFAAFGGADGTYTINISGTQNVDGIAFGYNGYTLTGGSSIVLGGKGDVSVASGVTATIATPLGGSAGLAIKGGGLLWISRINTYTGTTNVAAGILRVNGSIAAGSSVLVDGGATLGGNGTIYGPVTINGAISPGSGGSGKLTVGSLVLSIGSSMNFELGTFSDTVVVNGNLTLDGTLNITQVAGFGPGTYTIATYSGALTDNVAIVGSAPGGYSYSINATGGYVNLMVSALPTRTWIGGGLNNLWSTAANWQGSVVPVSSDSVVFGSSANPCSLDVNVTVRCLMFTSGFTQTFYTNGRTLAIGRMLSMNMPGTMYCNGSDTIRFSGSGNKEFWPKSSTSFPTIHQAGPGSTLVAGNRFKAINLRVTGGTFNLGNGMNDTVSGNVFVNGGMFDFSTCTLSVEGDVDLSGAADIMQSGGWLGFCAISARNFYPAPGVQHPRIFQNGTGTLTIRGNRLDVGRLNINNGQVVMDTSLRADTVYVTGGASLKLDTAEANADTIRSLEGSGTLDFGKTKVFVSSTLHLNMFSTLNGLGRLVFFGPETFMFEPKYGFVHDRIEKTGTGTVQASMYSLKASKLFVNGGVWDWFTAGNDTITDTLCINSGAMAMYGATVHARIVDGNGGAINFNHGVLNVYGAVGAADLSGLSAIGQDTGLLRFSGTGSSMHNFTPPAALVCPVVEIQGAPGDTVTLNGSLNARALKLYSGSLGWGNGLSHQVDTLRATGGSMNFGSCTVSVTMADADLSGLVSVVSTTATLSFSGAAGTQYLTPPSALSLPAINKDGAGVLMVSAYPMICKGLSVAGGTFDFGGRNCTVNGNMSFVNGNASTVAGLAGITISVNGGNASFAGQNGNLLNLAPASPWYLNVTGGGTLGATYATIGNCDASGGAAGSAVSTCVDASNNTNWTFLPPDTDPPTGGSVTISDNGGYTLDADPRLTISATGADSMRIGLAADTASALWKFYSTIDSITISAGGDGPRSVFVQFKDLAGNRSVWATGSTIYDATAPTGGSVAINDVGGYTSDADPRLTMTATGADSMRIGLSADTASAPWKLYSSIDSITISSGGDGPKSIFVQFKDRAGNRSVWATGSTTYDATAPTGGSVAISDVGGYTSDADPRMTMTATGADSMRIGLSADTASALWKLYSSIDSISISSGGDGPKSVFVQFKDRAGNRSVWATGSTTYDATAPTGGSVVITDIGGYTSDADPRLTMTATGADSMRIGLSADTASAPWKLYSSIDSITISSGGDGPKSVFVQFKDRAGNRSVWATGSTMYDATAPTGGSVVITDIGGYTSDADPRLTMTATGADSMRIGLSADTASAPWKLYSSIDSITISSGGDGPKSVFVQFKDRAGNRSVWATGSTIYDAGAPTGGSVAISDVGGYTSDADPRLTMTATGADSMRIGLSADTASALWKLYSSIDSISISSGGNGPKSIFVQFKDRAGNRSVWATGSTTYDATAPTGGSVVITDIGGYTSDADPRLTMTATGADSMRIALAADTASAPWKLYSSIDSITISSGGNGPKIVFVQFKDRAGNRSVWATGSTTYDASGPSGGSLAISDNGGYTSDADPRLTMTATGADSMRIGLSVDTASAPWKLYSSIDSISISSGGDGPKSVFVQFKDRAGNRSVWATGSTIYDATAPTGGSVVITDNNGYTSDADPRLTIIATGADSLRIALAADTASAPWKPYSSIDSITISSGGNGPKSVFVQFKDRAGNRSVWATGSTFYDATVPTVGNFAISDNNGYTSDADPRLTIAATGADSMRIALAADTATVHWKPYSSIDSITIASGGEGDKRVFVQLKNINGLRSVWISDTTAYDVTAPVGSIVVLDNAGATVDSDPRLSLIAADAVAMRICLSADTSAALWKTFVAVDSINVATGGGGMKHLRAQFRDNAGNRSLWTGDSTLFDTMPPVITIATAGSFDNFSWTKEISGTVTDAGAGQCTATVSVRREFDGWYWNGVAWQGTALLHRLSGCGAWRVLMGDSAMSPGMYRIEAHGIDRLGNASAVPVISSFTFNDTEKPLPLMNVTARAITCSTIVVSWTASASSDADSISIRADLAGFPASVQNGAFSRKISHARTSDTLDRLPSGGGRVYVRTFVKDRSGNWSDTAGGASAMVAMPDCLPPGNTLAVAIRSIGDSAAAVSITAIPAPESGLSILVGQGDSHETAFAAVKSFPYGDITIGSGSIRTSGWWFATAMVVDSSGNRSAPKFDSVFINNTPPRVRILADSTAMDDMQWVAEVVAADYNGDSVSCSIVSAPKTATFDGKRIIWTPADADIGKRSIVVSATDTRGAVAVDTFGLVVVNREEPPLVVFVGETSVNEEQRWRGRFAVTDPDPQDSTALIIVRKPAWSVIGGDSITGIPSEDDVGLDTLESIAVDRAGLRDTLLVVITINNVNDAPLVVANTLPATAIEKQRLTATVTVADNDRIDTLNLFWVVPSTWLGAKLPVRDTVTRNWKIVLEGTPAQRDTGNNAFVLKFSDRSGAVALLRDTILVLDADDPPSKPVITRYVAAGSVEYRVVAKDDRDTMLTYQAMLRSVDDTGWSRTSRSNDGVFRFYPLADGRYLFSASALDAAGFATAAPIDTLTVKGASVRISSDTVWEMVSVPAPYESKKLTGTNYLLHWDESITERQVFHFYQQKSEIPMLEPGKSYWRKGSGSDTVTLENTQLAVQPVKVPLVKKTSGWNQVASPYPYPVVWRGKSSVLWKWNAAAGDFEQSDSVLEPWFGYWVQSDITDSVLIDTVPFFTTKKLTKQKKTWFSGLHNWVMRAVLTTASGRDAENRFGVTPDARDGYDPLDCPEPPGMEERVSLYFPHGEWKNGITSFATDFRKKWEPVNVFEIGISGSSRKETATIRFEGYTSDLPVYLFMTDGDTIISVKPFQDVTVRVSDKETYRTLFVADNPDAMRRLPLQFSMGNAYPNPFCPSTRIPYVLPYRWNNDGKMVTQEYLVAIDIYDIMGRQLRNLVYRKMAPGSYEVYWDGKNGSGRVVASGHYYCRLKADKFESIRNLTVVR